MAATRAALAMADAARYSVSMTETQDLTIDELREPLLVAMLPHIGFDGWSDAARAAGAAGMGIDPDLARLALPGPASMIDAFTSHADRTLMLALEAESILGLKVRERITRAVRLRLEQAEPHREAIRRALAVLALPQNLALSARTLWRTADTIWRACGDNATDFNHYTKRVTLGALYSATLLYWLDDDSDDHAATWDFLDRRIVGVMRFEALKTRVKSQSANLPSPARFLGRLRYPAV